MVSSKWVVARYGAVILGAALLTGCAEQEGQIQRLQAENAALEHDVGRLKRETGDCVRELQKAKGASTNTKANDDLIAELRQALEALEKEKEVLSTNLDAISQKLMAAEKQLAEGAQQNAKAMKQIRDLEAEVNRLRQATATEPSEK